MREKTINTLIEAGHHVPVLISRSFRNAFVRPAFLALLMALVGCEAPLELAGVEAEKNKQLRRSDQLMAVASSNENVVVVGSDGLVLRSPITSLNWQRLELEGKPNLVDVQRCPNGDLIALSMEQQVWVSANQGKQWEKHQLQTPESLIAIHCAPDNSYWASGSFSTLLSSKDQGKTWSETSLNEDSSITHVQFFGPKHGIALGEFGLFAKTQDGGDSWELLAPIPNEFFPLGAHFRDAMNGWAAGLAGLIYVTKDGGASWKLQDTPIETTLYGFYAKDDRMFAFGDHGTALEYHNDRWMQLEGPKIPVFFRDGVQLAPNALLVVGGWGTLLSLDI